MERKVKYKREELTDRTYEEKSVFRETNQVLRRKM